MTTNRKVAYSRSRLNLESTVRYPHRPTLPFFRLFLTNSVAVAVISNGPGEKSVYGTHSQVHQ